MSHQEGSSHCANTFRSHSFFVWLDALIFRDSLKFSTLLASSLFRTMEWRLHRTCPFPFRWSSCAVLQSNLRSSVLFNLSFESENTVSKSFAPLPVLLNFSLPPTPLPLPHFIFVAILPSFSMSLCLGDELNYAQWGTEQKVIRTSDANSSVNSSCYGLFFATLHYAPTEAITKSRAVKLAHCFHSKTESLLTEVPPY